MHLFVVKDCSGSRDAARPLLQVMSLKSDCFLLLLFVIVDRCSGQRCRLYASSWPSKPAGLLATIPTCSHVSKGDLTYFLYPLLPLRIPQYPFSFPLTFTDSHLRHDDHQVIGSINVYM